MLAELEIVCRLADIEYLDGSTEMDVPVSDLRPLLPVFVPPPRLPQSEVVDVEMDCHNHVIMLLLLAMEERNWHQHSTNILCLPISIIFHPFPHVSSMSQHSSI